MESHKMYVYASTSLALTYEHQCVPSVFLNDAKNSESELWSKFDLIGGLNYI